MVLPEGARPPMTLGCRVRCLYRNTWSIVFFSEVETDDEWECSTANLCTQEQIILGGDQPSLWRSGTSSDCPYGRFKAYHALQSRLYICGWV